MVICSCQTPVLATGSPFLILSLSRTDEKAKKADEKAKKEAPEKRIKDEKAAKKASEASCHCSSLLFSKFAVGYFLFDLD